MNWLKIFARIVLQYCSVIQVESVFMKSSYMLFLQVMSKCNIRFNVILDLTFE